MDHTRRIPRESPYGMIEALQAENERLKQQLAERPQVDLKTPLQREFECSPDFENCMGFFLLRFLRERYKAEFGASGHYQDFVKEAGNLFAEFEKSKENRNGTRGNLQGNHGKNKGGTPPVEGDG